MKKASLSSADDFREPTGASDPGVLPARRPAEIMRTSDSAHYVVGIRKRPRMGRFRKGAKTRIFRSEVSGVGYLDVVLIHFHVAGLGAGEGAGSVYLVPEGMGE